MEKPKKPASKAGGGRGRGAGRGAGVKAGRGGVKTAGGRGKGKSDGPRRSISMPANTTTTTNGASKGVKGRTGGKTTISPKKRANSMTIREASSNNANATNGNVTNRKPSSTATTDSINIAVTRKPSGISVNDKSHTPPKPPARKKSRPVQRPSSIATSPNSDPPIPPARKPRSFEPKSSSSSSPSNAPSLKRLQSHPVANNSDLHKYKPSEAFHHQNASSRANNSVQPKSTKSMMSMKKPTSILRNSSHHVQSHHTKRDPSSHITDSDHNGGSLDIPSTHSNRKGVFSWTSTRSLLTEKSELENEPNHIKFLRYIRILPPHENEKPIKKWIRIMTWMALVCDMTAALVSIVTYNGITYCCDKPILSIAGNFKWDVTIRIVTYVYLILILLEIIPVFTYGLPLNLMNPLVGFIITFAVFFDDRIPEAVFMWVIECTAVCCEFAVYRLKLIAYRDRDSRLEEIDKELQPFRKNRSTRSDDGETDERRSEMSQSHHSSVSSFQDEGDVESRQLSSSVSQDLSQVRELRLLRERRILRQSQVTERRMLRYFFGAVSLNISLVVIAFLLIVFIGRSGGLCIKDMQPPNVFKKNQLERCSACKGVSGVCEVCRDDGTSDCYYPYY